MNKENRKGLVILLVMFAILGIIGIFYRSIEASHQSQLKQFGKIAAGKIEDVVIGTTSGGAFYLHYRFYIGDKKFKGRKSVECVLPAFSHQKVFENKSFPVIYSEKNPKVNLMLIGRKEFEEFGVAFPDSLKSISKKYFGCLE